MYRQVCVAAVCCLGGSLLLPAEPPQPTLAAMMRTVDLNVGQTTEVTLADGKKVTVKLLDLKETRDDLRNAVRGPKVYRRSGRREGDAGLGQLPPAGDRRRRANRLPGHEGLSAEATRKASAARTPGALGKDARLRLWPAGSPLLQAGHVSLPGQAALVRQRHADGQRAGPRRWRREPAASRTSTTTTASTSAAPRAWSRSSPPPTAWWFPPARRSCPATTTARRSRATTWSISWTSAAGTTATAICTRSFRASSPASEGQDGPADRPARQGGRQRRLVALALRHHRPAALGQVGHHRGLRLPLGGVPARVSSRNSWRWLGRTTWPRSARRSSSTAAARGPPPARSPPTTGRSPTARPRPAPPWSAPTRSRASTARC